MITPRPRRRRQGAATPLREVGATAVRCGASRALEAPERPAIIERAMRTTGRDQDGGTDMKEELGIVIPGRSLHVLGENNCKCKRDNESRTLQQSHG